MKLTLGPLLFHWPADRIADFYARIADAAPVDRVILGETVCSKRAPFNERAFLDAAERLAAAGKEVAFSTLALPTTKRERTMTAALVDSGFLTEVADVTALRHLPADAPFLVGPLVNVYGEGTLRWFGARGARTVCLPPELSIAQAAAMAATGVETELWAFGRAPLALSGRCYHARLAGRSRDSCQYVCEADPDGLAVDTVDGQPFLAVNGVQTLSEGYVNLAGDLDAVRAAGVARLRLSPHGGDMVAVAQAFRDALDGRIDGPEALARIAALDPGRRFANGYALGRRGIDWTHAA
ncbi:MAG: U32 family peptidase [Rhodobacteraceae bacterium]|nr:MAG: U32 family peptidase [Paracoccaceae bacterium]